MTEELLNRIAKIEELIEDNQGLNYGGSIEIYGPIDTTHALSYLDLKDVDEENYNFLLINLLNLAYQKRNKYNIRVLIQHFTGYLYTDLHIFLIILLNVNDVIENENVASDFLKFILDTDSDITTETLIKNCINWDSSPKIIPLVQKIEELLPQLSYDEWTELYNYAVTEAPVDNTVMMDYISTKLKIISPPVKIPKWIISKPDDIITSTSEMVSPFQPPIEEVVNILIAKTDLPKHGVETQFMPEYRISTYEERCKILGLTPNNNLILKDQELFRLYGPLNIMNDNLGQNKTHPCYNGCRMLTCIHFSNYEEDMYDIDVDTFTPDTDENPSGVVDWFMGSCMECSKKILRREFSLRVPQLDGGWRGCYCSFKCLTADMEALSTFAARMEDQLNKIGIYSDF